MKNPARRVLASRSSSIAVVPAAETMYTDAQPVFVTAAEAVVMQTMWRQVEDDNVRRAVLVPVRSEFIVAHLGVHFSGVAVLCAVVTALGVVSEVVDAAGGDAAITTLVAYGSLAAAFCALCAQLGNRGAPAGAGVAASLGVGFETATVISLLHGGFRFGPLLAVAALLMHALWGVLGVYLGVSWWSAAQRVAFALKHRLAAMQSLDKLMARLSPEVAFDTEASLRQLQLRVQRRQIKTRLRRQLDLKVWNGVSAKGAQLLLVVYVAVATFLAAAAGVAVAHAYSFSGQLLREWMAVSVGALCLDLLLYSGLGYAVSAVWRTVRIIKAGTDASTVSAHA